LGLAVSRETFLIGLSALGEASLRSSPKSKRQTADGQMHCPVRPGAQGVVPRPTKDALLCRRMSASKEVPALLEPMLELPSFLPLLTSGLLGPLGKLRNFSNPKRKYICIGWMTISALPLPIL